MDDGALLRELTPEAERLLNRHLAASKEWFPHELIPWDQAEGLKPGEPWDPEEFPVDDAVRRALVVNLLTEDNLPYYYAAIDRHFGPDDPWGAWNRRWTAEEGRHSIVIRDYLTVTRAVDPVALERGRMHQVCYGFRQPIGDAAECLLYVALQELATRIAHFNTGKLVRDQAGTDVMARVAKDENLHYLFYRDVSTAAFELAPSLMVKALERQVRLFEMPGTGIEGFQAHAKAIARAGIYDLTIHHDQILVPLVLRHWKIESLENLNPEAERARETLVKRIERTNRVARHLEERRAEASPALAEAAS